MMLKLIYNGTVAAAKTQHKLLRTYKQRLQAIISSRDYIEPESSLILPGDQHLLDAVTNLVQQKVGPSLKYHIVIGIGGSNLGTKAIYDALVGYRDLTEPERYPKLLFAETTDPESLSRLRKLVSAIKQPEELLISIISKSGGTTETLANFEIIMGAFGDRPERVVAISDQDSALWVAADHKGIDCLSLPAPVGGRYSVFSSVGLFPLASVGIDINALRGGAQQVLASGQDQAAQSAVLLANHFAAGYIINDNFFFHPELESLGKWYRQLMGESIGKAVSLDDQMVHTGISPTVSIGSTDLHSVGQLYLGGPKNKFTCFVYTGGGEDVKVPDGRLLPDLVPMINGKSAVEIMRAIYSGVKIAYQKAELPYMELSLERIDAENVGAYLQFKMCEMMYLGQLLNVNAFDQPAVESYKVETKRILESTQSNR